MVRDLSGNENQSFFSILLNNIFILLIFEPFGSVSWVCIESNLISFSLISKIFKSSNQKELGKLAKVVDKINALEDQSSKLEDSEFPKKTEELKQKFKNGAKLDDLLPEAYSLVRETSKRIS